MKAGLCLILLCLVIAQQPNSLIKNLPGLAVQPTFNQYSNYITVDPVAGRSLFYWFVESQNNPATDPVVLWLTGGPGCSSLLAFLGENGPFTPVNDGRTLSPNPYSWNKIANFIWLESPAGVGFSYSNTTQDYTVGDDRTAEDTYNFLLNFFKFYPQYQGREFWITGESYGGHYVPQAVYRIIQGNNAGNPKINIKGFMAGNAWTYMPVDNYGAVNTWWTRALVPQTASDMILQLCNLSNVGPLLEQKSSFDWEMTPQCDAAIDTTMGIFAGLSIYDIYTDVCTASRDEIIMRQLAKHGSKIHSSFISQDSKKQVDLEPCIDNLITTYLNQPAVQQAIHTRNTKWSECSSVVHYSFADVQKSVIPIYQYLFQNNPEINILVYSGDVDAIVPFWGTKIWVDSLKRPIKSQWRAWYDSGKQVGGFVTVYDKFTLSTVRDAGHQVPWYQPERGYILFSSFLTNGRLP